MQERKMAIAIQRQEAIGTGDKGVAANEQFAGPPVAFFCCLFRLESKKYPHGHRNRMRSGPKNFKKGPLRSRGNGDAAG